MENKLLETPKESGLRDAIHVPILSAKAGDDIRGSYVRIGDDGLAYECVDKWAIGVRNIFDNNSIIKKDQIFWILILPGKVTSLTHNFVLSTDRDTEVKNKDNDEVFALKSKIKNLEERIGELVEEGYEPYDSCRGCY